MLLGAGLLWFGWFGFNAGSALAANGIASLAFTNTMLAPAATLVVWTLLDLVAQRQGDRGRRRHRRSWSAWWRSRRRPASWARSAALALGAIAAVPSYFAILFRARTRLDDSLDVVAAHGVGGTVGALLTGVFAIKAWNGVADGVLAGNPGQLGIQALGVLATIAYSGVASFVLLKLIGAVTSLKAVHARGRPRARRQPARRGGLRGRRGRDPGAAAAATRPRPKAPRALAPAAEGGRS